MLPGSAPDLSDSHGKSAEQQEKQLKTELVGRIDRVDHIDRVGCVDHIDRVGHIDRVDHIDCVDHIDRVACVLTCSVLTTLFSACYFTTLCCC